MKKITKIILLVSTTTILVTSGKVILDITASSRLSGKKIVYTSVPSTMDNRKTLAKGSNGDDVVELQKILTLLSYLPGFEEIDGKFGNKTLAALKSFQEDQGLQSDGTADSNTWRALSNCIINEENLQDATNKSIASSPKENWEVINEYIKHATGTTFSVNTTDVDSRLIERLYTMGKAYGQSSITIKSGFRTYEQQKYFYESPKYNANKPRYSWHEYGGAVDIEVWDSKLKNSDFEKYGLCRPVSSEPWHIQIIENRVAKTYPAEGKNYFNSITTWGLPLFKLDKYRI